MSDQHDILTQADLAVYDAEPGTQLTHAGACIRAIASIGGDPATVGELVSALRACFRMIIYRSDGGLYHDEQLAFDKASAVLAKLPENSNEG